MRTGNEEWTRRDGRTFFRHEDDGGDGDRLGFRWRGSRDGVGDGSVDGDAFGSMARPILWGRNEE